MNIDKKIVEEIKKFNNINKYIVEQAAGGDIPELDIPEDEGATPPPPGGATPPPPGLGATPPPPGPGATPPPPGPGETPAAGNETTTNTVDLNTDPDVEEIKSDEEVSDDEGDVEEVDITDLIDTQKSMSDKQEEYFDNLFNQLKTLESKLGEMDNLVDKINNLETKFEKLRPKTPNEKLELRSLDSGPFNQKLTDFFEDKKDDFEKSGKHEYVLTKDELENISPNEIKDTFSDFEDDDNNM